MRCLPNKLYIVRLIFLICFMVEPVIVFAEKEVKLTQCSATRDTSSEAITTYVKLGSQLSARKTVNTRCTIDVKGLIQSGVFTSWPIYDLRSKWQYLQEHIKGSRHIFQSELLAPLRIDERRLLYLPRENAAFNRLCAEITQGNLGTTRIIAEGKPKLITMGVQYQSQSTIKASFAYLMAKEFVPQLINSHWVFYDLSRNSVENRHLLKQYNVTYHHIGTPNQNLIAAIELALSAENSNDLVFLLNKAQMRLVSNAKVARHFRRALYVDTTETSVSSALEQSLTALNYKLTPKPLPKCYRN